jgi:hypothetical protein
MGSAPSAGRGFFPLDEELELLPGKLTPCGHERLVRLAGWVPSFERAVELFEDFTGIGVSEGMCRSYTEGAGAAYEEMQTEEAAYLERKAPPAKKGADKLQISADGAMIPLLHGVWAEVRTLAVGEVQPPVLERGEWVVHTRNVSYFSRKVSAQEFQRLALVEIQRRGVGHAKELAAVMDGADWEQGFTDYHCPQATRILDFAHAGEHVNAIGEYLCGEHTPESQAWLRERLHCLKHEGPDKLLSEFEKLHRKHPTAEALSSNLAYLKKRKAQMQYPLFQAQGWPIGSGMVESGNKLVVEARLKGAGMHWAEASVNPMLAIRNILCSARWKEDWPRLEARLRQQSRQRRRAVHETHHPMPPTTLIARALQGDFENPVPEKSEHVSVSPKLKKNPWRNFKHGKALYQRSPSPKI